MKKRVLLAFLVASSALAQQKKPAPPTAPSDPLALTEFEKVAVQDFAYRYNTWSQRKQEFEKQFGEEQNGLIQQESIISKSLLDTRHLDPKEYYFDLHTLTIQKQVAKAAKPDAAKPTAAKPAERK